jgi:hypothetical protein
MTSLRGSTMGLKDTIKGMAPTSYWPLDDQVGSASAHDEMGFHDGQPRGGVQFAGLPFGQAPAASFDGSLGSFIEVPNDLKYSQTYSNCLTACGFICPLALDFANVDGTVDKYIYWLEKSVETTLDVEYCFRLYNKTNPGRHSRGSFYHFNLGPPPQKGAGSYMEYGVSKVDVPIEIGKWYFFVGEAEPFLGPDDPTQGLIVWKNGVKAARSQEDKYVSYGIQPQHGQGLLRIGGSNPKVAFQGGIAHVAIWNRLLSDEENATLWAVAEEDLNGR